MAQPDHIVMDQVKAELANAYLQEFFTTVRDKCFDKCVSRPGTSMSKSELSCMANCCDRYIDATKVVSSTVLQTYKQAQQEAEMGGGLGGGLH